MLQLPTIKRLLPQRGAPLRAARLNHIQIPSPVIRKMFILPVPVYGSGGRVKNLQASCITKAADGMVFTQTAPGSESPKSAV